LVEGEGKFDLGGIMAVGGDEVLKALEMSECEALVFDHPGDHFLREGLEEEVFAHESAVFVAVGVED